MSKTLFSSYQHVSQGTYSAPCFHEPFTGSHFRQSESGVEPLPFATVDPVTDDAVKKSVNITNFIREVIRWIQVSL